MFLYKHFMGGHATTEVDDVIRNLNFVLRSRRGSGYFLQTFGLTETGHRTPEEMVTILSAEIEENIRLYEPRVELVDIDEEHDEARGVRLVVSLRMRDADEKLRLVVDLDAKSFDIQPAGAGKRK